VRLEPLYRARFSYSEGWGADLAGNRLDQDPNAEGNQRKAWRFTVGS
jgi:hypothetical protein